jgi:hypothetical protein
MEDFKMKAKNLIGKNVIMTKPVFLEKDICTYKYCNEVSKIKHATDSHVLVENNGKEILLDERYIENWIDYDEFMKNAIKNKSNQKLIKGE